MAIPDYQTLMLPLLRCLDDGESWTIRQLVEVLAVEFSLTEEQLAQLLPSGAQLTFFNRVSWASTYMKKAGLIESPKRGAIKITARGRELLTTNPPVINVKLLRDYPEFVAFQETSTPSPKVEAPAESSTGDLTPEEIMEAASAKLRANVADDLLAQILASSPAFFERMVLDLLVKMGYGGSRKDAALAVGKSGDGGIDGIIKEDRLGLDTIYVQAKRWQSSVGRPEVQNFVGALHGVKARKGIILTTSTFTSEAIKYAENIENRVVLIDGARLANLMIDFEVGVSTSRSYEVKRIDSDYFTEE